MDQRVIVNFSPKTVEAMSAVAQYTEQRRTDVINQAVQLYDFLKDKEVYVKVGWKFRRLEW